LFLSFKLDNFRGLGREWKVYTMYIFDKVRRRR
jgi:hypothetical protein